MCLIDKKIVRVAEQDIPIYKVAIKSTLGKTFYSPHILKRLWRVNSEDFSIDDTNQVEGLDNYQYYKGFFHAFTDWDSAQAHRFMLHSRNPRGNYHILSGYIPEGTRYAIERNCICAHKMILNI